MQTAETYVVPEGATINCGRGHVASPGDEMVLQHGVWWHADSAGCPLPEVTG